MEEPATDNRVTVDRNHHRVPSNMLITKNASESGADVIKYYTMKNIILIIGTITVTAQVLAAQPTATTTPPAPAECSCGACEDSR
jgi:hypothetical protein